MATVTYSFETSIPETLINQTLTGNQSFPSGARLAGGNFLGIWDNQGDIVGRLFDASGAPVGSEFTVNTTTTGAQTNPHVAALADGRSVVVWTDQSGGAGNFQIQAQMLNADGTRSGTEIAISTAYADNQTNGKVTGLADGGWVVTWQDNDGAAADNDVIAQVYNADGTARGSVIEITADNNILPTVAPVTGGFVIVFTKTPDGGGNEELYSQRFDVNGIPDPAGPILLDAGGTINDQAYAVGRADGGFSVAYRDNGWGSGSTDVTLGHWTAGGQLIDWHPANDTDPSTAFVVEPDGAQADPSLTVLANGYFGVSWTNTGGPSVDRAIWSLGDLTPASFSGRFIANSAGALIAAANQSDIDALTGGFLAVLAHDITDTEGGPGGDIKAVVQELVRTTVGDGTNETLTGDILRDTMSGLGGDDTINAGGGNDRVNGGTGNNILDGGPGDDTVLFDFNLTDSSIRFDASGRIVIGSAGGSDTLSHFEHYQFTDGTVTETGDPLVDDLFYYIRNKDVFTFPMDAEAHYNQYGWHEGRDPNGFFSTAGYLGANQDVEAAGLNPLQHYDQYGWHEGRDPAANFDTTLYLLNNPDVAASGVNPLTHYLETGREEGRQAFAAIGPGGQINAQEGFDAEFYLLSNPDVGAAVPAGADAFAFALQHYNQWGWHEGRDPSAFFDTSGYLAAYADVAAAGINPLEHYHDWGWREGRDPSVDFDTSSYLAAYPDVAAANIDPLIHYLQYGVYEGRSSFADGSFS